jgi:hypothetical protein
MAQNSLYRDQFIYSPWKNGQQETWNIKFTAGYKKRRKIFLISRYVEYRSGSNKPLILVPKDFVLLYSLQGILYTSFKCIL